MATARALPMMDGRSVFYVDVCLCISRQKLDNFVPETYRMDVANERQEFLKCFQGMESKSPTLSH